MIGRSGVLAVALAACCAAPASAQTDPTAMAHAAAANQLGILEYCKGRGDVGADTVTAERGTIARLPASSASTDAAEALGRQGTLSMPNGTTATLASLAGTRSTTVSALCRQMGSATQQAAASYGQAGLMPGGMAQMPAMPRMPAMPTMPSMGGLPPMPGTPSGH